MVQTYQAKKGKVMIEEPRHEIEIQDTLDIEESVIKTSPSKPFRPQNGQFYDHTQASTIFENQRSMLIKTRIDNQEFEVEHEYPFFSSKHLNKTGINEDLVRLN